MHDVETLFLEVSRAVDEHDMASAKTILDEILAIDPGYGRAHNYLGWIYETKIKDFERAAMHYKLAIKFCNRSYPPVYVNYAYLLIDYDRMEEAAKIIEEGLKLEGADKATFHFQKGKIAERKGQYVRAFRLYEQARRLNFNKEFHQVLAADMERIVTKMNFWKKLRLRLKF